MKLQERYDNVLAWFEANVPAPESELHWDTPFHLLVAVILSAQCTDKRVNMVTPPLLAAYPTPQAMAKAEPEDIFEYIRSVSYPNSKAQHLVGMARGIVEKFGGQVPQTLDELMELPGVGRKTASVILIVAFDKPAMPVDTHVFRVAERIGLTTGSKNPLETERQLVKHIPRTILGNAHHYLILHGRYVCTARKPHCPECGLHPWCRYYAQNK